MKPLEELFVNPQDFGLSMVNELKHHKTYCVDLNCHVYRILERAVSEAVKKDIHLEKKKT